MPLTLLVGPANAGKVELLLDRYLDSLEREPVLIVPNRSDVERVERDLLRRTPVLLAGSIGTFDDIFERLAPADRRVASDAQRVLVARRAIARAELNGLGRSARFGGFTDALLAVVSELEAGLLDPTELEGDLARLYAAYCEELDALGLWDRDLQRRRGAERLAGELGSWQGQPVFAYGFEDLTGAEWAVLAALAGRVDVTVSLPYEPGRPAFASLTRTSEDLTALADGRIEELPPRAGEVARPALAHLERALFGPAVPDEPPALEGAIRFFEGAGPRGALELVGEEILALLGTGMQPERIGVVCPSLERLRAPLDTAFGSLGIPYGIEGRIRLGQTPFGQALVALLRFAWLGGGRRELFSFLRTPYSGLPRTRVDFIEGRLRGRSIHTPERVLEETENLNEGPLTALATARTAATPVEAVRAISAAMLRSAYGLEASQAGEASRQDLRAYDAVARLAVELEQWVELGGTLERDDVVSALERATVRLGAPAEPGRVAVLDLMRARTRRFDAVFVLGLEEGSLPRRAPASPFLDEEQRRELASARLQRPDQVSRERYLFYTACTRALERLYLVREAATDEGSPREPSPFWEEVRAVFPADDTARWTRRRALSALTWPLETAPSERERLRAVAALWPLSPESAEALAKGNGWERRLDRARRAFDRPTRLVSPGVLAWLGNRTTFGVTELERFADCSSAWLIERVVDPKTIDAEVDPMLRGSVAHQVLFKFYAGLPKELGCEQVSEPVLEPALRFLRTCFEDAMRGGVRLELTELQRRELEGSLWRDLEQFIRAEAKSELPLVPRRFEVSFGSERSAQELQRGLDLGGGLSLSGKIDRIDLDPHSASGIVQDYKSGKSVHSAAQIESELRLQIPLYMLVLRDLVGIEPLGGLYRALAGERKARGVLRAGEETVAGMNKNDYLDDEAFWALTEKARDHARGFGERIRAGDTHHDPKGGECPSWCDLWPMCRVKRA